MNSKWDGFSEIEKKSPSRQSYYDEITMVHHLAVQKYQSPILSWPEANTKRLLVSLAPKNIRETFHSVHFNRNFTAAISKKAA